MAWQAGESGNEKGRQKLPPTALEQLARIRKLARTHAGKAIGALLRIMEEAQKESDQLAAAKALLEWGFGSPAKLEADAGGGNAVPMLASLKPEERLRALRAAVAAEESKQAPSLPTPSERTA